MKLNCIKIMILLGILTCIPTFSADFIRTFNANSKLIQTPFYGEIITDFRPASKKHKPYYDRTIIWYQSPEHFRIAITGFPAKGRNLYQVRSGDISFGSFDQRNHHEKWYAMPISWVGNGTPYVIYSKRELKNPKLLGIEELHGIRVEHWRGRPPGKYAAKNDVMDIWMSTDKRIPIVLKMKSAGSRGIMTWELANLQLNKPMPDYLFQPQMEPINGILAHIKSQYKPLWMTITWYILYLLSYVLLIYSLTMAKSGIRRILLVAASGLLILGLLKYSPGFDRYLSQYSGLPVLILIALMTAAALMYCIRWFKIPGDVRAFAGTRWPVFVWIAVMVVIGLYSGRGILNVLGMPIPGLSLLLPILATLLIYLLPAAALEEVVFRGYVTGILAQRFTSGRIVNILQSLAFTAMHIPRIINDFTSYPALIGSFAGIFIWGLIFGGFRLKYRNLGASWMVHAVFNIGRTYGFLAATYSLINSIK